MRYIKNDFQIKFSLMFFKIAIVTSFIHGKEYNKNTNQKLWFAIIIISISKLTLDTKVIRRECKTYKHFNRFFKTIEVF